MSQISLRDHSDGPSAALCQAAKEFIALSLFVVSLVALLVLAYGLVGPG